MASTLTTTNTQDERKIAHALEAQMIAFPGTVRTIRTGRDRIIATYVSSLGHCTIEAEFYYSATDSEWRCETATAV
jgi:hypothetical protein